MKTLTYNIQIAAPVKKVWDTMLQADTYQQWVKVSWPGSYYDGKWEKDADIKFISPGQGGTLAHIVELKPQQYVLANHIAVLHADGSEDRSSELAKGWIGTEESYRFTEKNGMTELTTEIKTSPKWEMMFNDGWPKALAKLKEICEQ